MRAREDWGTRQIEPNVPLLLSSPRCVASLPKYPGSFMQTNLLRLSKAIKDVSLPSTPTIRKRARITSFQTRIDSTLVAFWDVPAFSAAAQRWSGRVLFEASSSLGST